MSVKEFWGNRSYLQKGFIIGILLYALFFVYIFIVSSNPIRRSDSFFIFVYGPLFFVVLFGYIGFLIGLLKKDERDRIVNTIRMKDEGHFLKPNKGKILITFWVVTSTYVIIMGVLCLLFKRSVCHFLFYNSFFHSMMVLLYSLPKLSLLILVLLAYTLSCFRFKNKKMWLLGIVLYLMAFISISQGIVYEVSNYNAKYGYSCNTDNDCYCNCHGGFVAGPKYLLLSGGPKFYSIACEECWGVCENNQCERLGEKVMSVEYCERREGYKKAVCYMRLSENLNDFSLCNKVEDAGLKERCKSSYSYRLAQELSEPDLCNKIEYEYEKDKCILESATSKDACKKIESETIQEECFAKFPSSIEDCEKIIDVSAKHDCYYNLAPKLKDISLCDKAGWNFRIDGCIAKTATSLEDCNKIEDGASKEECISRVQGVGEG